MFIREYFGENMKKSFFVITLIFLLPLFSNLFAQEDSTDFEQTVGQTYKSNLFSKRTYFNLEFFKHPSITIYTGFNYPTYVDFNSPNNFNSQNTISFILGKTIIETHKSSKGGEYSVIESSGLFLENFSSKWKIQNNSKIDAKMWRFGILINDNGYGYRLGKKNYIFLTHSNSFNWSKFDVENLSTFSPPDSHLLNVFASQFRFGTSFQSGISIVLHNSISLDGRYERSVVFPGHKFWYWAGSSLIEYISLGLLDQFIETILDSSPYSTPIVNGILKGALSFGIYELRKDKMNWPFNTSAPLFNETFKFGIKFLF